MTLYRRICWCRINSGGFPHCAILFHMICFVFLEVNLDNIKSNHLYLFPPTDSKPLVWLGRNNLWTFFGSLLDFFWCNTHRKSSHQNAHSGELLLFINIQDMDVNNARADMLFIEKSAVETCLTMQVKLTLTAVEMYLCYLFCSTLQRSNKIYICVCQSLRFAYIFNTVQSVSE